MKSSLKVFFVLLVIFYLILYFSYRNGYYIDKNKERSILTEEKIKEYETDLKNGIDVSKKDYVVIQDNYDNNFTRLSLSLSKRIERVIDKVIKYFFKKISARVDE